MRYILFGIGVLTWVAFAYDIENNRDFMTWIWLLTSLLFFVNFFIYDTKTIKHDHNVCLKKDCNEDTYHMGMCFKHYCMDESETEN